MLSRVPSPKKTPLDRAFNALREHALSYPETREDFPWGESAIKVKGKVFLFMRGDKAELGLSTKLAQSSEMALLLPFAQPTGYGLGKSGWVSATFKAGDAVDLDMLKAWIDESFRNVAPKKLLATSEGASVPAKKAAAPKRKVASPTNTATKATKKPLPREKPARR